MCGTKKPKVNIIAPVYNVEPYLKEFLDSVFGQTFQDFDLWIVNDKSTDGSLAVIEEYKKRYPTKVYIINNSENMGLCGARNAGLDACNSDGEYILLLDSDDYIENTYLEKMVHAAEKYKSDVTICGLERFDDATGKNVCTEMIHNPDELITDISCLELMGYINPVVWNKLFRRPAIENIRFTQIKRSEDTVFLFTAMPNIKSVKFINEVLYHYRLRGSSLSGSITDEIYDSMLEGFYESKKLFLKDGKFSPYMPLFTVQMFIRCGMGGACRMSFQNMRKAPYYVKRTLAYMNDCFPEWKKNRFLSMRHFMKKPFYAKAVSAAALMYRMHLFCLFVYVYWFTSHVLKHDVRA